MIPNLSEIAGNEHQILAELIHTVQEVCVRIFDCHLSNEISSVSFPQFCMKQLLRLRCFFETLFCNNKPN